MSSIRSELAWVVEFPIPCGKCGKETLHTVASFVNHDTIECRQCGAPLDLGTHQWTTLRNTLRNLCIGEKAPIASVKKR